MIVGSFGNIVFETSPSVVRTFSEAQRTTTGRWAKHDILGAKPIAEFIGPDTDEVTLPIQLNVLLLGGKTIESELSILREIIQNGKVGLLTIGEDIFGKYYLESMGETRKHFGKNGQTVNASVTLTLKEFTERG